MIEAIPPSVPTIAFLEIDGPEFEIPVGFGEDPRRKLAWLHRSQGRSLVEAVASIELPPGVGHVYVNGEVGLVSSVKRAALERGLNAEKVSVKAYWGRGKGNEGNGEPEKRPD
jgi:NADPH-dependent ferric siderophore reductase